MTASYTVTVSARRIAVTARVSTWGGEAITEPELLRLHKQVIDDVHRIMDRPGLRHVIALAAQATLASGTDDCHETAPVESSEPE